MKKLLGLLSLLVLITNISFANYKKVKDINGIKIPKGIIAKKDTLEDKYRINSSIRGYDIIKGYVYHPISIRILNNEKKFYNVIDIYYCASDWLWVNTSTIYIENKDQEIQKYVLEWQDRKTRVSNGIIEYIFVIDEKLEEFLLNNIQEKSKVNIRFSGKNYYNDKKVSKSSIKSLYNMLQFYKQLQNQKPQ